MARNIARAAGIGVVAPGAADAVALFEDHEIVDPALLQPDRGEQPGHAGADDDDARVLKPLHRASVEFIRLAWKRAGPAPDSGKPLTEHLVADIGRAQRQADPDEEHDEPREEHQDRTRSEEHTSELQSLMR